MELIFRFITGLAFSGLIAFLAYRRRSLSRSGMLGAMLIGTSIWCGGGWVWGLVLIAFFVLSSLLSHYKDARKASLAEKFSKGSQRDLGQALANGGMAALIALAAVPLGATPTLLAAFLAAMASANADTWATELGVLNAHPPRLITTGKPVEVGTSGAVSPLGLLAAFAGSLTIGLSVLFFMAVDTALGGNGFKLAGAQEFIGALWVLLPAIVGGMVGSLFDSYLGATVQAIYYSEKRRKETEKVIDPDGTPNRLLRGWRWMDNDWVNFISSAVGALAGFLVGLMFL